MEKNNEDNRALIDFWNRAFTLSEEEKKKESSAEADEWKELAPSEKLFLAACSLGRRKKVLDYGCGSAWASIIAAKSGCDDVTAVDVAPEAACSARFYAAVYGVENQVRACCIAPSWLQTVPSDTYDGLICSNVLDVVPPETAEEILREISRIVTGYAAVIIGMNYWLSPEAAAAKGMELQDGNRLYIDGILRLVSRTDEEWAALFSPCFTMDRLEYFAWPGEKTEARRLFYLRKRG